MGGHGGVRRASTPEGRESPVQAALAGGDSDESRVVAQWDRRIDREYVEPQSSAKGTEVRRHKHSRQAHTPPLTHSIAHWYAAPRWPHWLASGFFA